MNSPAWRAQVKKLPQTCGVYLFKDGRGRVLYVGKALDLRSRVRSYLATTIGRGPLIEMLVSQAKKVESITTDSEIEALILEANLIRRLKPKHNTIGKDDKSASWVVIDGSDPFPAINLVREKDLPEIKDKKVKTFGPFLSTTSLVSALKTIRRIWPYRDCSPTKWRTYAKLGRGCLYHQIGVCPAPCVGKISRAEYRRQINQIIQFLNGKKESLIKKLTVEMLALAKKEQFEQAAVLRQRIFALERLHTIANRGILESFAEPAETFVTKGNLAVEAYDVSNISGQFAVGSLVRAQVPLTAAVGSAEAGYQVDKLEFTRDRYRTFRIKYVVGINDLAMLAEILTRRLRRARRSGSGVGAEPGWDLPDLILIDGGATHLARARQAVKTAGLSLPVVAVAKGPTRKRVDLHWRAPDRPKIKLTDDQLSQLALKMREEAHRFAISYYRHLHRKTVRS